LVKLTTKVIKSLDNAIAQKDFDEFEAIVGKLTPNQLVDYSNQLTCTNGLNYLLWSTSTTWGFTYSWATLARMSQEEKDKLKAEMPDMDVDPPENITPDKPFAEHFKWAPQDQARALGLY
jgi:hypothetical protein